MSDNIEATVDATEAAEAKTSAPTSTHISLANYVTANSDETVTPAQAQAVLTLHSKWQKSPERIAEREQEKAAAEEAKAAAALDREAKKAEREQKAAEAKAKKAAKEAAKAAKDGDDDSDLGDDLDEPAAASDDDDLDGEEATPAPKRTRRKGGAASF